MSFLSDEIAPELVAVGEPPTGPRSFDRPKIPLTLLTGYLGAGKSTLLQYILTADHGYRIAVCMNDFGDSTDIEAKSLIMSNRDDPNAPISSLLALPNGCLCCSVKDLGIAAIEEMVAAQRDAVDWVIVELTGLADPVPIAKRFWANEEMGDLILDSVICVVDGRNVLKQLGESQSSNEPNVCQEQIACADVILLNKVDLIDSDTMITVESTIASINPTPRINKTVRSQIPLAELFNVRAYNSPTVFELPEDRIASAGHACECESPSHTHIHQQAITTISISLMPLNTTAFTALNLFLEALLWDGKILSPPDEEVWSGPIPQVLRVKGIIAMEDGTALVLQGVADIFELRTLEIAPAIEGASPLSKIVFIGRDVGTRLNDALRAFVGL